MIALCAQAQTQAQKPAQAPAQAQTHAPAQQMLQMPQPPALSARNYMLVDVTTHQVLAAKAIDERIPPASLTKLMTAYVVFDALKAKKITLQEKFPVSERAWKMPGSRMFIDPRMQVPVNDLLYGMLVQSGNDAAMALAQGVGGTEENFVRMMNDQAKALGMTSTHYANPDGLPETDHLTSARDLSILATSLIKTFPEYMYYFKTKEYRYPGTPAANSNNRNLLLFRDPSVDGMKTGHTQAAGYCLVATAKREVPGAGERRLLSIVLGTESEEARANESQQLLNWGYTAFDFVKVFGADQTMETPQVWKGSKDVVKIGSREPIYVDVPSGTAGKVHTVIERTDPLIAPLQDNQQVGTLKVELGDTVLKEVPVVTLEAVPEAGFFGRMWDSLRLWIK